MLAGIAGSLVDRLANVDPIVQHPVDELLVDAVTPAGGDASFGQFPRQQWSCRVFVPLQVLV